MESSPQEKKLASSGGSTQEKDSSIVVDLEKSSLPPGKLQRQLKSRHVAMISIGGVIGTGLFLGTASSLENGGPVGLLLGYIVSVVLHSNGEYPLTDIRFIRLWV